MKHKYKPRGKPFVEKHGLRYHPLYKIWCGMMGRCYNPNEKSYPDYGGRGIKICDRWLSVINFVADMGQRPTAKHTIDRIDNDGNYELKNCRWATRAEQNKNKRKKVQP